MKKKQFLYVLVIVGVLISLAMGSGQLSAEPQADDSSLPIYVRPSIRFGTDERTLHITGYFDSPVSGAKECPLFQPEVYVAGYRRMGDQSRLRVRHLLAKDRLILGANVFYDTRETSWGTHHDQIGMGLEAMAEIPMGSLDLGVSGRFNYYIPLSDPIRSTRFTGGGPTSGFLFREGGSMPSGAAR